MSIEGLPVRDSKKKKKKGLRETPTSPQVPSRAKYQPLGHQGNLSVRPSVCIPGIRFDAFLVQMIIFIEVLQLFTFGSSCDSSNIHS